MAVIVSQLLSPILWDHYALLLLLPVAWLVDRGHWWAVVFVLATPWLATGSIPPWFYPLAFWGREGWTEWLVVEVMVSNYVLKVLTEVVMTPLTYGVVNFLKRAEHEDHYDYDTDFNPFSLKT